ncbi:MAG: delta-60 repeat domain-containing protein [Bacteriovoracaceae bacterium]|nr:delta-60 repeat domain-containing protein [Bacteriovoracaceae bacterium]
MTYLLKIAAFGILLCSTACGRIEGKLLRPLGNVDVDDSQPAPVPPLAPPPVVSTAYSKFRPNYDVNSVSYDSLGRKIIAGDFWSVVNHSHSIVSLEMDGSRNSLFDEGLGFNGTAHSLRDGVYQSDGKFVAVGRFTSVDGVATKNIIRLNPDGTVDPTFVVPGTGFNSNYLSKVVIQPDNKIVVIGDFTSYNGVASRGIARLNSDGSLDTTFSTNIGTGASTVSSSGGLALQADGKIIFGGAFTSFNGSPTSRIVRLNSDGTVDGGFNIGTGFNSSVYNLKLQGDGKILVGGAFTTFNGIAHSRFIRLNSDGTADGGFTLGPPLNGDVDAIELQADGKILIGGSFSGAGLSCVARLESTGSHDATFNSGATWDCSDSDWVGDIVVRSDGKIFVAGQKYTDLVYYADSVGVILHNSDGSVDASFSPGVISYDVVEAITLSPDGFLIAMGNFSWMGGESAGYLYRETTDGEIDATFAAGTGFDDEVNKVLVLPDDSILAGGNFTQYDSTNTSRLAKILPNGTLDPSFLIGTGFSGGGVLDMAFQADGKIIVAGNFTTYQGTSVSKIARLNSDGTLDGTFIIGTGFAGGGVSTIRIQADGKILLGGYFTSFNGTPMSRLARLNSDGTLDNTFAIGTGFGSNVNSIEIQTDGKVIVGGAFTTYQGAAHNRIVRLLADGSVDPAFTTGTGFGGVVMKVLLQADGKLLVGGWFTAYNGSTENRLVRLNTDGTIDPLFTTGVGFDGPVYSLTLAQDGSILVGGNFFSYKGLRDPMLILLQPDGTRN